LNETFWVGILVGAFVGLLFTFVARPLERALDRHGEKRALDKAAEVVEASPTDKQVTRDWLVIQLIEIAVVGAVAGIGASIMFGVQSVLAYSDGPSFEATRNLQSVLVVIGQGISLLGAAVVLRISTGAVRTARLLRGGRVRKPQKG
jgi:hypothetical protein